MNRHYWLMILLLSITLLGRVCLATIGKDEFWDYLNARDTSISSYSLDMQRISFKIPFDDYDLLTDFAKKVNSMEMDRFEPNGIINELIQNAGASNVSRLRRIVLERGEHFKSTLIDMKTESMKVKLSNATVPGRTSLKGEVTAYATVYGCVINVFSSTS